MKLKDIDKLNLKDAKDKLKEIYARKGLILTYLTIENQLIKTAKEVANATISIEDESNAFERFLKWGKESLALEEAQTTRLGMLDEEELRKERRKRTASKAGSVESYAKNKPERRVNG
jgi:hypothetical protein